LTADYPGIDLPRDRIRSLLAEHGDPDSYHEIIPRSDGGWIIITATHVLPDGTIDQTADTHETLKMHTSDKEK
jgi:hypothetical protein